ncbi:MAG: glycoside hydrolase family 130 protein, partial [Planctomycetes bacterium]|nr:glycoside hydrolase family 130 protein [Planctomycetota bacterium]
FLQKLREMHGRHSFEQRLFGSLGETFTFDQLRAAIDGVRAQFAGIDKFDEQAQDVLWLARSNYHLDFPPESDLSERVIFPVTENESRGIEDARFVRFIEPDGRAGYYATYTAYNDVRILPQLIHTEDFLHFEIHTLNGCSAQNKGMALFPRRINGKYCMVARLDGENLFLLRSDNVYNWDEAVPLCRPTLAWEVVQIGNCGSPLETDAGWLLLTHGVGPMRQYWIGALLLDRDDPTTVLGHLEKPLLAPRASERDGYVPNVVYSCGAMIHHDTLIIPYGVADTYTRIATVPLPDLLAHLKS